MSELLSTTEAIINHLSDFCEKVELTGQTRKQLESCRAIEILCVPETTELNISHVSYPRECGRYIKSIGLSFFSQIGRFRIIECDLIREKAIRFYCNDSVVKLYLADLDNFGIRNILITGPKTYTSKYILRRLYAHGFTYRDYIFYRGQIVPTPTEEDVYPLINSVYHDLAEREEFTFLFDNKYPFLYSNPPSNWIQ